MREIKISHYKVDVYTETPLHEWWKYKTEKFDCEEDAIAYAKKEIERGNHARIYQVAEIKGWQ